MNSRLAAPTNLQPPCPKRSPPPPYPEPTFFQGSTLSVWVSGPKNPEASSAAWARALQSLARTDSSELGRRHRILYTINPESESLPATLKACGLAVFFALVSSPLKIGDKRGCRLTYNPQPVNMQFGPRDTNFGEEKSALLRFN